MHYAGIEPHRSLIAAVMASVLMPSTAKADDFYTDSLGSATASIRAARSKL